MEEFREQAREGETIQHTYNLSAHPEHAAALGMLVSAWACVEHALCLAMSFLIRSHMWNVQAAYYAIINNSARIAAIKALSVHMIGAERFREPLVELLDRANTLSGRRNNYVHKKWIATLDMKTVYLVENIGILSKTQKRKVDASEMRQVADQIMQLEVDIKTFVGNYSNDFPLFIAPDDTPEALHKRFS